MPKTPLDSLSDQPRGWSEQEELALQIIEALTASDWQTIADLTRSHTSGNLSFEAWRSAVGAIVERCARCAD